MTRPGMTGQQADALAAYIVSLRPGQSRWTKPAVYDALGAAAARFSADAESLARAAIRAALTSSIVSPEVIAMPGAHWESVDHSPAHEPRRATVCPDCHDRHMPDAPCTERAANKAESIVRIAQLRAVVANAKTAAKERDAARRVIRESAQEPVPPNDARQRARDALDAPRTAATQDTDLPNGETA